MNLIEAYGKKITAAEYVKKRGTCLRWKGRMLKSGSGSNC